MRYLSFTFLFVLVIFSFSAGSAASRGFTGPILAQGAFRYLSKALRHTDDPLYQWMMESWDGNACHLQYYFFANGNLMKLKFFIDARNVSLNSIKRVDSRQTNGWQGIDIEAISGKAFYNFHSEPALLNIPEHPTSVRLLMTQSPSDAVLKAFTLLVTACRI